jgi:hypothetical protein
VGRVAFMLSTAPRAERPSERPARRLPSPIRANPHTKNAPPHRPRNARHAGGGQAVRVHLADVVDARQDEAQAKGRLFCFCVFFSSEKKGLVRRRRRACPRRRAFLVARRIYGRPPALPPPPPPSYPPRPHCRAVRHAGPRGARAARGRGGGVRRWGNGEGPAAPPAVPNFGVGERKQRPAPSAPAHVPPPRTRAHRALLSGGHGPAACRQVGIQWRSRHGRPAREPPPACAAPAGATHFRHRLRGPQPPSTPLSPVCHPKKKRPNAPRPRTAACASTAPAWAGRPPWSPGRPRRTGRRPCWS